MRLSLPFILPVLGFLSLPAHSSSLFPFEKIQLTREHIESLPDDQAKLFAFGGQFDENSAQAQETANAAARCRYTPSDGKWPSTKAWQNLAKQLSAENVLLKPTPQSVVCYPGTAENKAKCQDVTKNWSNSHVQTNDPIEVLSPVFQGLTCTPPTIFNSGNCTQGGYPTYVINTKTVLDIQLGINFARNNGLRLVVKNTGHDFTGKSAGAGALSLWTHGLRDLEFIKNYVDGSGYKGPAIKAGAGVQAFELYKFANEKGVVAVGGEGQTVGIMGGYIQGGGHSPLSSLFGMAADQVLSLEVVTPTGDFVTANATSEPDLFWALRGGGGGTFGVVTSVTIKAFKDMPVTAASWSLSSTTLGKDKFWAAVKAYMDLILSHVDAGTYSYYTLSPVGKDFSFAMQPFFAPNQTAQQVNSLLRPFFSTLTALNIPFSPKITEYKSFYPAWQAEFPLEPQGAVSGAPGSRLFPRSNFASETGRNITFNAIKQMVETGHSILGFHMAPTLARGGNVDNAVNPAWRNAVMHAIALLNWPVPSSPSSILSSWNAFSKQTLQKWRDITPGSGAYLNEADRLEPNWQQSFWGSKYARLLEIKQAVDVKDVFWAANAVGSEGWVVETVDGLPGENGKLCRVNGTVTAVGEV
ncbi:FAD-binding domain-containing protein [Westerdykella ornata]|uniref:FAD-binding domain-containing protein n=1 Tax=Westerdykella ornata TaxID=318751 RepID=A0A6A6J9L9_WESOR|nr:FAD-binding domain-containing protein [Westerdykella ornata]KAF2273025.1 FAD-binding domain-containing protein [Westerdykella ornata]